MRKWLVNLVAIIAMMSGFYLSARYFAEPAGAPRPATSEGLIGNIRPDFKLGSHNGEFVSAADFSGKTLLINFWATWCGPCRHEMPMLMDLQRQHGPMGLQVIGIALDDVQKVREFVDVYGISYPILVGGEDVYQTSANYGNVESVLPYSVLVDSDGIVRWQYTGEIPREKITSLLSELL
jgi:thiol-disulfide isomerase/thioredoxin